MLIGPPAQELEGVLGAVQLSTECQAGVGVSCSDQLLASLWLYASLLEKGGSCCQP